MEDIELVREYAAEKSESAFKALVERHLPLVYSAALRQVGNPALAEDISQVVFLLLAHKAAMLPGKTIVAGWLYRTTRHVAAKALRQDSRRRRREKEALAMMQNDEPDTAWTQMAPFLDEAMAQLGELDRAAVLLRYFQNKSLREVGDALGVNDDTAQKRVSRALDKLRNLLLKRGIVISAVAATGLLATRAAQFAPVGLGRSVTAAAVGKAAAAPSAYALLLEASRRSLAPKLAVAGAAALLLGGLGLAGFLFWPKPAPLISVASLPASVSLSPPADPLPAAAPVALVPKAEPATHSINVPEPAKASNAPPRVALVPPRAVPVRPSKATNGPVNPPTGSSDDQALTSSDAAQQRGGSGYGVYVRRHGQTDPTNNDELAHFQVLPEVQRVQTLVRVTTPHSSASQKKN